MHRADPRVKLVAAAAGVLCIVTTPPAAWWSFLAYGAVLFTLIMISQLPLAFVLKRMLMVVPFAVLIAAFIPFVARGGVVWSVAIGRVRLDVTHDGLMLFWGAIVKSSLSILCMVLLTATTRFDRLLKGLEMMRCPRTIVMVLAFMYRYVFLLSDELMRLLRAREARDTGGGRWHGVKSLSWIVGVLFVRAYERAERVYLAMCSRGFDGTIIPSRTLSLRRKDILVCAAVICAFGAVRCAGGVR